MPVSNPTLLTSAGIGTGSTSRTTTTVSPSANSLLLLSFTSRGSSAGFSLTSTSISSTFGGTDVWTEIAGHAEGSTLGHILAYLQMGATPPSGAIRVDFNNSTSLRASWAVYTVTGHDTATVVSESTFGDSTQPWSLTIADIVAGNLLVHSVGISSTADFVGDVDFSTLIQVASGGTNPNRTGVFYDPDDNEISGTFTGSTISANNKAVHVLTELAQSTAGAVVNTFVLERIERHYPRGHMRGVMRGAIHFDLPVMPRPLVTA